MQVGQPPAVPLGKGPGRGVRAQQFQVLASVVGERDTAFGDVAAQPVVQGDAEPRVGEAQPQLVPLGRGVLEAPLGAAPLVGPYGERGADEAGAALDGVLLAAVERGVEGPVRRRRPGGEGLGVGERDPRAPVQVEQLVAFREVERVAAARSGEEPGPAVRADLDHQSPTDTNTCDQGSTSSGQSRSRGNACGQLIASGTHVVSSNARPMTAADGRRPGPVRRARGRR